VQRSVLNEWVFCFPPPHINSMSILNDIVWSDHKQLTSYKKRRDKVYSLSAAAGWPQYAYIDSASDCLQFLFSSKQPHLDFAQARTAMSIMQTPMSSLTQQWHRCTEVWWEITVGKASEPLTHQYIFKIATKVSELHQGGQRSC